MKKYENLAPIIAENLIYYRKKTGLTQAQLAEKLNYSDKSISKWERGESIPDVLILYQLADLYGLSINDFVSKNKKQRITGIYVSKVLILLIASSFVWFFATLVFFVFKIFSIANSFPTWLIFIYAITVNAIVLTILVSVFFKRYFNVFPISVLIWSIALDFALTFSHNAYIYLAFIAAIPAQILVLLYFAFLFRKERKIKNRK